MSQSTDFTCRRCLRFSLRTLFVVVTALCVWLGSQWNWMKQRQNFLAEHQTSMTMIGAPPSIRAPQLLSMMGEVGRPFLVLSVSSTREELSPADRQMLKTAVRLFPEAISVSPINPSSADYSFRRSLTPSEIKAL